MQEGWPVAPVAEATPGPVETEEQFIARRNSEINAWLNYKADADKAVENERAARTTVTSTLFPTPKKGTQRYELGDGYKVKLVYNLVYTLGDKDKIDDAGQPVSIQTQIEELEDAVITKHGDLGAHIIHSLIKWKPEISGSAYEKLDKTNNVEADIAAMIEEHLTIKPGSPQLVFERPSEK